MEQLHNNSMTAFVLTLYTPVATMRTKGNEVTQNSMLARAFICGE
jgi:hypothetical protein